MAIPILPPDCLLIDLSEDHFSWSKDPTLCSLITIRYDKKNIYIKFDNNEYKFSKGNDLSNLGKTMALKISEFVALHKNIKSLVDIITCLGYPPNINYFTQTIYYVICVAFGSIDINKLKKNDKVADETGIGSQTDI